MFDQKLVCSAYYGRDMVCSDISDEKWAPSTPENATSRIWLLAEKEETAEESNGFLSGVGIAAASTLSLALCVYTTKRVKANRTDTDEFVRA